MIFVNTVYEVKLILGTVENLPIGSAFAVLFFVVAFLKKKKKKQQKGYCRFTVKQNIL